MIPKNAIGRKMKKVTLFCHIWDFAEFELVPKNSLIVSVEFKIINTGRTNRKAVTASKTIQR